MAYVRESWTPSGLGCGPNCNCGPCRARFAGFGERFIPEDEDEEQDPEQAPPEEGAEDMPGPPTDSAGSPQSAQNAPPLSRGPRASRRGRRAPRLSEYSFGHWMPAQSGWGRFAAADYFAPFGFYGGFGQAGVEQAALSAAVRRGERNPNKLTDMLFFARHPERHGARLRPEEVELTREWRVIRDQVVRPVLMTTPAFPQAVPPQTPSSPLRDQGGFKQNLVQLALQEWDRWKRGALKEGDPQMRSVLEDYWRTGAGWLPDHPNWWSAYPWSAAFISWLMKKAGAGKAFKYSAAHAEYIRAAKQNRLENNANPFKAYRVSEARPSPGDLVCKSRSRSGASYDNIQPGMATHCDVVTSTQPGRLITIGGNVANSVSSTPVRVDSSGFIQDPAYFAVIKVADLAPSLPLPTAGRYREWLSTVVPLLQRYRGSLPLDLLLGWIDVESGGNIKSHTSLDERGYFQLHPGESKALKLDHQRLSIDPDYSVQGGLALVRHYANRVQRLGFAPGNDLFWRMVKFLHALGSGAAPEMLRDMRENGAAPADWAAIRQYALQHREALRERFRRRFGKPFDPVHFTENVDKAFARGKQLAQQVAMP